MPSAERFDLVVVGGGPGGYAAALRAAGEGLRVALVEREALGGTCLHRGCIPAKALLETAHVLHGAKGAADFGVVLGDAPTLDLGRAMARKSEVVDTLFKGLSGLVAKRGIEVFSGSGQLVGPGEVAVTMVDGSTTQLEARAVVLATGSVPRELPGLGPDGERIVSSDGFFQITKLPRTALVVGGGAIGCEFASALADFGAEVTVVEGLDRLLAGCDADISAAVARSFKKRKLKVLTGLQVTACLPKGDGSQVTLSDGSEHEVDLVVVSVGRRPLTEGIAAEGLDLGIDAQGFIPTDEQQRTAIPGVYAVGDVVAGSPQLAHVAFAEAIVAVGQVLGSPVEPVNYARVPWAIYCRPEVAFAGLTEAQAAEQGIDVVVASERFLGNGRARIIGETDGVVKVVCAANPDGSAGQVLGVHLCGPWVTEQLSGGYLAVNWEASAAELGSLVQPHPSLTESFGEVALQLAGRGIHLA